MKTKIIYNSRIAKLLFSAIYGITKNRYVAIMLFGFVFTTCDRLPEKTVNHESIHIAQYRECFGIGTIITTFLIAKIWALWSLWFLLLPFLLFYILYSVECIISFVHHLFAHSKKSVQDANKTSYNNCAFEQEARANESNPKYLQERKAFSFIRYYGKV